MQYIEGLTATCIVAGIQIFGGYRDLASLPEELILVLYRLIPPANFSPRRSDYDLHSLKCSFKVIFHCYQLVSMWNEHKLWVSLGQSERAAKFSLW